MSQTPGGPRGSQLQSLQGGGGPGPARGTPAEAPAETKPDLCSRGLEVMHSPGEPGHRHPAAHTSRQHPCSLWAPADAGEVQGQGGVRSLTLLAAVCLTFGGRRRRGELTHAVAGTHAEHPRVLLPHSLRFMQASSGLYCWPPGHKRLIACTLQKIK